MVGNQKYKEITFNVSHSHDHALIAISKKYSLGIDIEKINRQSDYDSLVTRFFSKPEQSEFNALPKTIKARAFCACWTRKEAFIKAIGDGVTYGLDTFDVTVDPEVQTPKINLHKPSEGCDLDYVPNIAREMKIDAALTNSFGFGGTNGSLAFTRFS